MKRIILAAAAAMTIAATVVPAYADEITLRGYWDNIWKGK
jgi:hypothetical protein